MRAGSRPGIPSPPAPKDGTVPTGRGRRIAFTVASGFFAVAAFAGLLGFELFAGWFDASDGRIHRVHLIGFGILYGLLLTAAAAGLTWRPERKASLFFQVVAVGVAAVIGALLAADGNYAVLGLIVLVAAAILFALHPARSTVLHPRGSPSGVMAALVVVGAVPLVWFALTTARLQRTGLPTDPHVSADHWANMAAMAIGLVLVGLLAAMRFPGWRITAWCAGIGTAVYGLASIVFHRFPNATVPYPGSEGIGWGIAALVGGLVFVIAAEWEATRPLTTGADGDADSRPG